MIDLQIRVARSLIYDRNRIRGTHKKPNYVIPWLRFSLNALGSWHRFAPVSSRFVFFALKLADAIGTCLFESPHPFFIRRVTLSPELIAVVYVSARSRAFLSALAAMRDRVADSYMMGMMMREKKSRSLCARHASIVSQLWTRKRYNLTRIYTRRL